MRKANGRTWLLGVLGVVAAAAMCGGAGVGGRVLWSHEQRIQANATSVAVLDAKVMATMTAIHKELATIAASIPERN